MNVHSQNRSGFTIVELLTAVAIVAILASLAVESFESYARRTKASEASMSLNKIVNGESEYYAKNYAFLTAGPTNIPPSSLATTIDFGSDPAWTSLGFATTGKMYFGYQVSLPSATQANCEAMADLNGDGLTSLYRRTLTLNSTTITVSDLYIFDELE